MVRKPSAILQLGFNSILDKLDKGNSESYQEKLMRKKIGLSKKVSRKPDHIRQGQLKVDFIHSLLSTIKALGGVARVVVNVPLLLVVLVVVLVLTLPAFVVVIEEDRVVFLELK